MASPIHALKIRHVRIMLTEELLVKVELLFSSSFVLSNSGAARCLVKTPEAENI